MIHQALRRRTARLLQRETESLLKFAATMAVSEWQHVVATLHTTRRLPAVDPWALSRDEQRAYVAQLTGLASHTADAETSARVDRALRATLRELRAQRGMVPA